MTDASTLVPNRVGLPSDCNFELKPSGVRARSYRASILPTNKSSFNPGDLCVFYIPGGRRNVYLDTSQSYLRMTIKNTDGTATTAATAGNCGNSFFLDNTAACVINRLDIFHASNLLESIQQYNVLFNYIMDCNISSAQKLGLSSMLGTSTITANLYQFTEEDGTAPLGYSVLDASRQGALLKGTEWVGATQANTLFNQQFTACLPLISGTIGLGAEKYLPLGKLSDDIRCEFTFENQNAAVVFSNGSAPTSFLSGYSAAWTIIDAQLELCMVELSDEGEEMVNSMVSPERPIYIHGNSWRHYVSTLTSGLSGGYSTLVPARFGSLKSLVTIPRPSNSTSAFNVYSLSNRINPNFSQMWLRVGSNLIPQKYITLENSSNTGGYSEAFSELQKAWHSLSTPANATSLPALYYNVCDSAASAGKYQMQNSGVYQYVAANGYGYSPVSLAQTSTCTSYASTSTTCQYNPSNTFQNGFVYAQELESYANKSDVLLSGYNTLSQQIFFEANITNAVSQAYTIDFYANYDQILVLENGILSVRF